MTESATRTSPARTSQRDIYSVSRLNREARMLLERGLGMVWLEAEISNFSRPASGHWYFSLKDDSAQLRCAMFRQRNRLVRFTVKEGSQVLVRGRVSLYEPRGDFQLIVDELEEAGEGLLLRRFEELKRKLADQGLFDAAHKQPLPPIPQRVGVITSPSGAALRDILHILARRFPAAQVLVYPVAVQGESAPREIVDALQLAGERDECDVLILARGGGSIEDLWAFNDEAVARTIHDCPIPVICGVGHETDVTIADFVADERAPTPSGAAERVVPDRGEWLRSLAALRDRIETGIRRRLQDLNRAVQLQQAHLGRSHPGARLREHAQRLDESERRLQLAIQRRISEGAARLEKARSLLLRGSPVTRVDAMRLRLDSARRALAAAGRGNVADARRRLEVAASTLHAVSPLATLERGYAIVIDAEGKVLHRADQLATGQQVRAKLARGGFSATVTTIEADTALEPPGRKGD